MMVNIILFALVSCCVASISYDCDTRSSEMDSRKLLTGSYQEGVLPCEFKDTIDIPSNYNKNENPQNHNHVITIAVSGVTFLEDTEKCNVSIEGYFTWTDRRLKFDKNATTASSIKVPLSTMKHFWNPAPLLRIVEWTSTRMSLSYYGIGLAWQEVLSGLYLVKEKDNMTDDAAFVGFRATFHKYITLMSPPFTDGYTYYPYDKHEFILYHDLGFEGRWLSPDEVYGPLSFSHPSFKIHVMSQNTSAADDYANGAGRKYVIVFSRKVQSYIVKTYLPSGSFVVLSWLSMLVPVELATERVALCTATLLTITTFFNTASQFGPSVSYLRAYDIWLLVCIMFVFIILFENIGVMKITGRFNKIFSKPAGDNNSGLEKAFLNIRQLQHRVGIDDTGTLSAEQQQTVTSNKPGSLIGKDETGLIEETEDDSGQKMEIARRVDRIAIFLVTAAILIFNMTYWIWLLATKQTKCERDAECSRDM